MQYKIILSSLVNNSNIAKQVFEKIIDKVKQKLQYSIEDLISYIKKNSKLIIIIIMEDLGNGNFCFDYYCYFQITVFFFLFINNNI